MRRTSGSRLKIFEASRTDQRFSGITSLFEGCLVGTEPILEELKRLLRRIPIMLMSAGDHTFNFLAPARFDFERRAFTEWYANFQDADHVCAPEEPFLLTGNARLPIRRGRFL